MPRQILECLVGDRAHRPAQLVRRAAEEMVRQQGNVAAAFPQRWQANHRHAEPVEKVAAECALRRTRAEIPVRGRDDPGIRADGFVAAHAVEFLILQHPQQFGLGRGGHTPISALASAATRFEKIYQMAAD